jgi:hypothetical protein
MVSRYGAQIQDDTKRMQIVFASNLKPLINYMALIAVTPASCLPYPFAWSMTILVSDVAGCCRHSFCRVHVKILVMAKSYGLLKKYSVICSFLAHQF